ncbi:MAG: AraC family transcriptional regulator, partial [Acidimicrobiales bacterium]
MAVSARSAKYLPRPDNSGMVDMRTGGRPRAGTFPYEGNDLVTTWHSHDLHQIEYALQGVVEVETATAHYLLPPQQAAW